jgi:formylglycine-generating enzyme required for sulfatase activity
MNRLGLVLPTEAQWNGSTREQTAWWTGDVKEQLAGAANLADAYCKAHGGPGGCLRSWLDDGWTAHAPVGSYRANSTEEHVVGNVGVVSRRIRRVRPADAQR